MFDKYEKLILVGAFLLCALFFVSGYYWGKRSVAQEYNSLLHQQTLDEKIQGALCGFGRVPSGVADGQDSDGSDQVAEQRVAEQGDQAGEDENSDMQVAGDKTGHVQEKIVQKESKTALAHVVEKRKKTGANLQAHGYAQLVGFGSPVLANKYKDKLIKAGFSVHVVDHVTPARHGKGRHWYQVVTQTMPLKQLQKMVDTISKKDRLKGCKIISV